MVCAVSVTIHPFDLVSGSRSERALRCEKITTGSGQDFGVRDWNDPLAAPLANVRRLLHDLGDEIPRPDEQEVGLGFFDAIWRQDRDVRSGQELSLLVRIAI